LISAKETNTASQFVANPTAIEATGLPVAAAFAFMPGLRLRKGYEIDELW
jgi:hypothetical protein